MFLTINGLTVPVASGSVSETRIDRPAIARGFGGGLHSPSSRRRRTWRVQTTRMPAVEADKLEALIVGLGESIPYDSTIYGERLRPLLAVPPVASIHPGLAADGRATSDGGKFLGAVAVEPATTNILPATLRDCEGALGGVFVSVDGATLTASTANRYEQLQSLQVAPSAVVNGVRGGFRTVGVATSGGTFISSCYALSLVGGSVRCFTRNTTLGTISSTVVHTLSSGVWQRIYSAPLSGFLIGHVAAMEVVEDTPDLGQVFFVDALQIEAGTLFTSWADPSRAAGALVYDSSDLFRNLDGGFTLSGWVRGFSPLTGTNVVFNVPATVVSGGSFSAIRLTTNLQAPLLRATDKQGRTRTVGPGSVIASNLWHFAVVYRDAPVPSSSTPRLALYINGVLVAGMSSLPSSGTYLGPLDLRNHMTRLEVLYDSSGPFYGTGMTLDDLCLTPWPMSASEVAAVVSASTRLRRGPALQVSGTFTRGELLECFGVLAPSSYETFHQGAAGYDSSARSVSFDLEER